MKSSLSLLVNGLNQNIDDLVWPSYSRETLAMGGHWRAKFTIGAGETPIDDYILESWFSNYLGGVITESFGGVDIAKFMINSMRLVYRGDVLVISLDDMANKIGVIYSSGQGQPQTQSSWYSNQTSIDKFGTKELIIRAKETMSASAAAQLAQAKLEQVAFPRAYPSDLGQFNSERGQLDVELIGLVQTLNWQHYNSTSESSDDIDTAISNMISGADYVAEGNLQSNSTQVSRDAENRPIWKRIEDLTSLEDSSYSTRWLAGVYRGGELDYFEADETNITYFRDMKANRRILLDAQNSMVPDPFVLPGRVVFTRDIMAGQISAASLRDDPRASFIQSVVYDESGVRLRVGNVREAAVNNALAIKQILAKRKRKLTKKVNT